MHFEKKGTDPTRLHKQAGEQACHIPGVLPPAAGPLPIQRRKSSFSKEIQHTESSPSAIIRRGICLCARIAPRVILISSIEPVKVSSTQNPAAVPVGWEGSQGQRRETTSTTPMLAQLSPCWDPGGATAPVWGKKRKKKNYRGKSDKAHSWARIAEMTSQRSSNAHT